MLLEGLSDKFILLLQTVMDRYSTRLYKVAFVERCDRRRFHTVIPVQTATDQPKFIYIHIGRAGVRIGHNKTLSLETLAQEINSLIQLLIGGVYEESWLDAANNGDSLRHEVEELTKGDVAGERAGRM